MVIYKQSIVKDYINSPINWESIIQYGLSTMLKTANADC